MPKINILLPSFTHFIRCKSLLFFFNYVLYFASVSYLLFGLRASSGLTSSSSFEVCTSLKGDDLPAIEFAKLFTYLVALLVEKCIVGGRNYYGFCNGGWS